MATILFLKWKKSAKYLHLVNILLPSHRRKDHLLDDRQDHAILK